MKPAPQLRVARPVTDLERTSAMYCRGLGLEVLSSFADHEGFDGVILGVPGAAWHFEFTQCRQHPVAPAPTPEDLIVLYLPDRAEWRRACESMLGAGFAEVSSFNPWWERSGRTFADGDGYRSVLCNAAWRPQREGAST